MGHKVLKSFPYAEDGTTTRQTQVDEVLNNVNPDHVPGLVAAGLIEAVGTTGTPAEAASKLAGEALANADLSGTVDSQAAVSAEMASAQARISDGMIGAPEARAIVDAHTPPPPLGAVVGPTAEELEEMTVPELKAHADAAGIDLGDATKKADIIAAIQKPRA